MLYKKNASPELSPELFRNPTSEYRGAPFWAWNCRLEQNELNRQIEVLKKMGFGGFHMHVRTGMDTVYLSDEHMKLVKGCVDKAREEKMLAWLYDEDRYPSGAAGGYVTREKTFRARHLCFTADPEKDGTLLAAYDITLNPDGTLASGKRIDPDQPAEGMKRYAFLCLAEESPWYNNQTYIDTLNPAAVRKFIELTHEKYYEEVGEDFDGVVPAIFTDEPQFTHKSTLGFADQEKDVNLPWTDDLPDTFKAAYGEDLLEGLPELIWELPEGKVSTFRYHYHDHVAERFASSFADQCGGWCRDHRLMLTGHMMNEHTLEAQTNALGDCMRSYRGFDLPGVDVLCAAYEFTTVKQCQSAVHQFGREGMLSELYGVTGWDFDFRGHKIHGDWQAALGITVRVHHLSWVSMGGSAKRDYPASISYQSPWFERYGYVEDHFARVNTALTRGRPATRVGVIHPVESYWLHWGPSEQTADVRNQLEDNFHRIIDWLLNGSIDFDFISESLLPGLCEKGGAPLKVGCMAYDAIVVPGCETLRSSTLERLEAFRAAGGRLIFMGDAPKFENALPSERGLKLFEQSTHVSYERNSILSALEPVRTVDIRDASGRRTDNLLHAFREDGEGRWLFIAHSRDPYNPDISRIQKITLRVKGMWKPTLWNTLDGTTAPVAYRAKDGVTEIYYDLYDYDSLLLRLEPGEAAELTLPGISHVDYTEGALGGFYGERLPVPAAVRYTLTEPNVLLLDNAESALDDGEWQPAEELLRIDIAAREKLGWPDRRENQAQPWTLKPEEITHSLRLRFRIRSEIALDRLDLAMEDPETAGILWNGRPVPNCVDGWWTDKAVKKVHLPGLLAGENVLELKLPFGQRTNVEWCYLLGAFGVKVAGSEAVIEKLPEALAFSDIVSQGLPFYGGSIIYHVPFVSRPGTMSFRIPRYRGGCCSVDINDNEMGTVAYPPYEVKMKADGVAPGMLNITLYTHRNNCFGPVHLADRKLRWKGGDMWFTRNDEWSYEYNLTETGLLSAPVISVEK